MPAGERIGGLGSSHTTPCGAAVPARPPTRSSETTHLRCGPQWVTRATGRGTRVVVQRDYLEPKTKLLPQGKLLIISMMERGTPRLPGSALPIVLIPFRGNLIQLLVDRLAPVPSAKRPSLSPVVHLRGTYQRAYVVTPRRRTIHHRKRTPRIQNL